MGSTYNPKLNGIALKESENQYFRKFLPNIFAHPTNHAAVASAGHCCIRDSPRIIVMLIIKKKPATFSNLLLINPLLYRIGNDPRNAFRPYFVHNPGPVALNGPLT